MERETRTDLEATLAARRELGPGHDDALVEAFVERIDQRLTQRPGDDAVRREDMRMRLVLGLTSLGTGIPISAIAASQTGLVGLALAWAGIVGVNVAFRR